MGPPGRGVFLIKNAWALLNVALYIYRSCYPIAHPFFFFVHTPYAPHSGAHLMVHFNGPHTRNPLVLHMIHGLDNWIGSTVHQFWTIKTNGIKEDQNLWDTDPRDEDDKMGFTFCIWIGPTKSFNFPSPHPHVGPIARCASLCTTWLGSLSIYVEPWWIRAEPVCIEL